LTNLYNDFTYSLPRAAGCGVFISKGEVMQNCSEMARPQPYSFNQIGIGQPLRVAIVDDSEDFRIVLRELLQMLFNVEIVGMGSNGFEALELVAEFGPDLLIMDVNMPVLDGATAASLVSTHFPTTTILMMSGDDSPEVRERCMHSGAFAFTHKDAITRQISDLQPQLSR
jgi:CheY-like chemotaxis protein